MNDYILDGDGIKKRMKSQMTYWCEYEACSIITDWKNGQVWG